MEEASNATIPGFLIKLWTLVDDTNLDDVIRWSEVYLHGERIGGSRGVRAQKVSFLRCIRFGAGSKGRGTRPFNNPTSLGRQIQFLHKTHLINFCVVTAKS